MIRRKIESENIQNDKNIIQQKENGVFCLKNTRRGNSGTKGT